CTWAQPVMPGLTLWRRDNGEICSANASLRAIGCGRGPTIDISPSSTFTSWGSSSIFVRLRIRPTRVTRGSFLTACLKWHPSSIVVIDRNLTTLMTSLLYPCRVWRKNTGPRESSLTANETASKSGENTSSANPAMHMSNARFANRSNADSGGGRTTNGTNPPTVAALDDAQRSLAPIGMIWTVTGSSDKASAAQAIRGKSHGAARKMMSSGLNARHLSTNFRMLCENAPTPGTVLP